MTLQPAAESLKSSDGQGCLKITLVSFGRPEMQRYPKVTASIRGKIWLFLVFGSGSLQRLLREEGMSHGLAHRYLERC